MRAKLGNIKAREANELRVLSYNTLAQSLARRDWFPTNKGATQWNVRFPAMQEELRAYDPDILFLQEIDSHKLLEWSNFLGNELEMGVYYFKPRRKQNGLIIGFKRETLHSTFSDELEFDSDEDPPRQSESRCGGLLVVVKVKSSGEQLVLCTTHQYWHPDAHYERLRGLLLCISRASKVKNDLGATGIILGGDLNSTPSSPAYELLTRGALGTRAIEELEASAQVQTFGLLDAPPGKGFPTLINDAAGAVAKLRQFQESMDMPHLRSCYAEVRGEPAFTNWADAFQGTIDYIFVSDELTPTAVLATPSVRDLGPHPNSLPRMRKGKGYPSDHVPIAANIAFKPKATNS